MMLPPTPTPVSMNAQQDLGGKPCPAPEFLAPLLALWVTYHSSTSYIWCHPTHKAKMNKQCIFQMDTANVEIRSP